MTHLTASLLVDMRYSNSVYELIKDSEVRLLVELENK